MVKKGPFYSLQSKILAGLESSSMINRLEELKDSFKNQKSLLEIILTQESMC